MRKLNMLFFAIVGVLMSATVAFAQAAPAAADQRRTKAQVLRQLLRA